MNDKDYQIRHEFIESQTDELGDNEERASANDELKTILSTWTPLHAPASLRRRVLNSYRADFRMLPLWRRLLTASVSVPAPVAVAALLLLVFGGAALFGKRSNVVQETPPTLVERVRTVEIPVLKTEVETHVVYRNRWRAARMPGSGKSIAADRRNMSLSIVNQENRQGFLTGTDLSGFRLNEPMSLTVIKKAEKNEK